MVKGAGPVNPSKAQQAQQAQQAPTLQQKEAQQLKQQKAQNLTSADRARLASQAGFQRTDRKKGSKGLDIGDSSKAPIPLPDDDVDPDAWSQETLDGAQGSFALAGSQFGEIAEAGDVGASLGAAVVGSSYLPTEEDIAEMEDLAKRKSPEPVPMLDEASTNASKLFGIRFPEETPVGHKVLAVGLVVAGEQESVKVGEGGVDEAQLAGGIEKVTKKGNQAVGEAQKMSKGINKELSVHRTFVFKR